MKLTDEYVTRKLLNANPGLMVFTTGGMTWNLHHKPIADEQWCGSRILTLMYDWKGQPEYLGLYYCLDCERVGVHWKTEWGPVPKEEA